MQVNERRVGGYRSVCVVTRRVCISRLTSRRSQPPLALSVPLSRFTPRVGGGSAFFVRPHHTPQQIHIMKKRISLIIVGCLLSTMLLADDTDSRQKLVGTWVYSVTNRSEERRVGK